MGEEFQNKLIELLSKIEAGTPGAFKELVEQKSIYYSTLASNAATASFFCFWVLIGMIVALTLSLKKAIYFEKHNEEGKLMACGTVAIFSGVMLIVCFINIMTKYSSYMEYSAIASAPLGTVLDSIR